MMQHFIFFNILKQKMSLSDNLHVFWKLIGSGMLGMDRNRFHKAIMLVLNKFSRNFFPFAGFTPATAAAIKSLQACPTLCDPIDGSPPGSPIPGILQARTLEWVAISFSNAWKWKVKVKSFSCVQLPVNPWTAAHQAPRSMGFARQEYWSGMPLPSLGLLLP